eukprot:g22825.t1
MVKLTMFGTDDNNTLTGKYGVARQSKRDCTRRFATTGPPKGSAGGQMPVVARYTWSAAECRIRKRSNLKVLDQLDIPIMQDSEVNGTPGRRINRLSEVQVPCETTSSCEAAD